LKGKVALIFFISAKRLLYRSVGVDDGAYVEKSSLANVLALLLFIAFAQLRFPLSSLPSKLVELFE
jgi:hypothetical protein